MLSKNDESAPVPDLRRLVEDWLPYFNRDREDERDAKSDETAMASEAAQTRAQRVIEQYRRAEDRAGRSVKRIDTTVTEFSTAVDDLRAAQEIAATAVDDLGSAQELAAGAVSDLRDAHEEARVAGEAVIAEVAQQ